MHPKTAAAVDALAEYAAGRILADEQLSARDDVDDMKAEEYERAVAVAAAECWRDLTQEEREGYIAAVRALVGDETVREDDIPEASSSAEADDFIHLVERHAEATYPRLYACMLLARQRAHLRHEIWRLLNSDR